MKKMRQSMLFLVAVLALPMASFAQSVPTISFDPGSIPTMYVSSKGEVAGIYPAIVKRAFEIMHEPVAVVALPFRRQMSGMVASRLGAGGVVKTPERLQLYDYSEPYYVESVSVYYLGKNGQGYSRIDDLRGRTVGVVTGWAYGQDFDDAMNSKLFHSEGVSNDVQNFKKLRMRRIDFAVATTLSGQMLQTRQDFQDIESSPVKLTAIPIHLAFHKDAHLRDLLRKFNVAVATLRASGELERIVSTEYQRALGESQLRGNAQ